MNEYDLDTLFNRQINVYGKEGQEKLKNSTVLIIGCGGLGSTCSTVLSRSGVGRLILVDVDEVSISNIHRQILYTQNDLQKSKSETAAKSPLLCLSENIAIKQFIDEDAAYQLIQKYKPVTVMDCTDNFQVRYEVNKACVRAGVPMVHGSVTGDEGQVSVFCYKDYDIDCPCYACVHPTKPAQLPTPPPVIPGICTIVGTLQAQQAISIITGVGDILVRELLTINLFKLKMRRFKLRENSIQCEVCGVGKKPN